MDKVHCWFCGKHMESAAGRVSHVMRMHPDHWERMEKYRGDSKPYWTHEAAKRALKDSKDSMCWHQRTNDGGFCLDCGVRASIRLNDPAKGDTELLLESAAQTVPTVEGLLESAHTQLMREIQADEKAIESLETLRSALVDKKHRLQLLNDLCGPVSGGVLVQEDQEEADASAQ